MNLSIHVTNDDQVTDIKLVGEIDVYTAPNLKDTLLSATKKEGETIRIDLEKVTYMDSTGLGALISGLKSSKEHNSKLVLNNIQDRVYRLFDITGLKEVFDIESTIRGGM